MGVSRYVEKNSAPKKKTRDAHAGERDSKKSGEKKKKVTKPQKEGKIPRKKAQKYFLKLYERSRVQTNLSDRGGENVGPLRLQGKKRRKGTWFP